MSDHSVSHPHMDHTIRYPLAPVPQICHRTWVTSLSWTLAMNCSWASDPPWPDISSGVNSLYVDVWSTFQFFVSILDIIMGPTFILCPSQSSNSHISSGKGSFHLKTPPTQTTIVLGTDWYLIFSWHYCLRYFSIYLIDVVSRIGPEIYHTSHKYFGDLNLQPTPFFSFAISLSAAFDHGVYGFNCFSWHATSLSFWWNLPWMQDIIPTNIKNKVSCASLLDAIVCIIAKWYIPVHTYWPFWILCLQTISPRTLDVPGDDNKDDNNLFWII